MAHADHDGQDQRSGGQPDARNPVRAPAARRQFWLVQPEAAHRQTPVATVMHDTRAKVPLRLSDVAVAPVAGRCGCTMNPSFLFMSSAD